MPCATEQRQTPASVKMRRMNILAFDTSSEYLSLALLADGRLYSRDALAQQQHSSWLLPWIADMLGQAGLTLQQLDGLAFGNGPGAFTGLRIGAGVAQGLALGADKPLLPVSGLLALAEQVAAGYGNDPQQWPALRVVTCLDARMQQVYLAAWCWQDGQWQAHIAPGLFDIHAVPALEGEGWLGAGSGFAAFPELQQRWQASMQQVLPEAYPHARYLLRLAAEALRQGRGQAAGHADLLYLRDKVAQTLVERGHA